MRIERLNMTNFRCFGSDTVTVELDPELTALIGNNGSGKTAALLAMMRLLGVNQEARRVQQRDFHVPADEDLDNPPTLRTLSVEVILAFPELDDHSTDDAIDGDEMDDDEDTRAVPEFFHQMAADENGTLKCRIRLEATWQNDGSLGGSITESRRVIRTFEADYGDDDWNDLPAADRARIQFIYVPAARDGAQHLTSFLRGRLWRAAQWSPSFRDELSQTAQALNTQFGNELPVAAVESTLTKRWGELHSGGTDATPGFRPVPADFAQVVDRAELFFEPTETGQKRRADDLSDGQRSLLHIALTATALDLESEIAAGVRTGEFDASKLGLPTLTILAVEEPENSLAPFYVSRIVQQMLALTSTTRAQMLLSSHSTSVLGRVKPHAVRHFRVEPTSGTAVINRIRLPDDEDEAAKYVQEAVRAYPELYFARFVVLGEGSSEQVALPILAAAANVEIDRSFVAIVPLGGRHVSHLWKLLDQLQIPHATLLDLDRGRHGGGAGRIRHAVRQLNGLNRRPHLPGQAGKVDLKTDITADNVDDWIKALRKHNVYFCEPLDLDWSLLTAFFDEYTDLPRGDRGPTTAPADEAVLGPGGNPALYRDSELEMRWYRYLFLGRSKPATHLRVLTSIDQRQLRSDTPAELKALIGAIKHAIAQQ